MALCYSFGQEAVGAARLQDRVCAVSDVQEQPRLFPPAVRVRHSLISPQTSEEQSCSRGQDLTALYISTF